jgi:hypothetical protein
MPKIEDCVNPHFYHGLDTTLYETIELPNHGVYVVFSKVQTITIGKLLTDGRIVNIPVDDPVWAKLTPRLEKYLR